MSTTHPQIKAQRRTTSGSGAARKLRRQGLVPATIYGNSFKAESLQVDAKAVTTILKAHGTSAFVVDLDVEGTKRLAVVQARQSDPLSKKLLHVDFHGISADEEIHASVSIEFVGTPVDAKLGGLLNAILHQLEVSSKPDALPEHIEVDISGLKIGDAIHIGDIKLPAGVKAMGDAGTTVVTLVEPRVAEAAETASEPEVVGAKKSEDA